MRNIFLKPGFWLQLLVWAALFMMPFTFLRPEQTMGWKIYLLLAAHPLALFIVFYSNYLVLFNKFFSGKKKAFWIINILMVLVLAMSNIFCMEQFWSSTHKDNERKERAEMRKNEGLFNTFNILIFSREVFNLSVVIGIAGAIVMARRLTEVEKARQETEQARQEAENAKVEAELSNLRSQINPHFLLNTLNNIYALTAFDKDKAQSAIMDLSKLLRYILYDNQQPFVLLTEEVVFLKNYISLMKIRYPKRVEIVEDIDVPSGCKVTVAPMIFISLVENAFKHGISPTADSFILLNITVDDNDRIVCCVENSNHPKKDSDRSGHGIGLELVERRLELTYPGKYEWERGLDEERNVYRSRIVLENNI